MVIQFKLILNNFINVIDFDLLGDKRFKILNLLPLKLPEASVKTPNLDTKYKNIVIYGLETAKILDVE